jgi:hypothetical protein
MNKFLLAGAVVMFAGIGATVAVASDHKSAKQAVPAAESMTPARATVITPGKVGSSHKHRGRKHHHIAKRHHPRRTHMK